MMNEETKAALESGRPVMVFNIEKVGQLNPNATVVNNTYYGDQFVPKEVREAASQPATEPAANPVACKPASKPETGKPKPSRPSTLARVKKQDERPRELMTFSKRGILPAHLKLLYQALVGDGWLAPETQVDAFLDLFSGERSESTIIWAGKYGKGTLVYLFQQMEEDKVISVPKGFSIPNILMGHVTDTEGNLLTNLDKGDAPAQRAGAELLEYQKLLKQNAARMGRRPARQEEDEEADLYGNDLNPYELEDEGLRYSSRIR